MRSVALLQLKVYGGSPHVEKKLAELLSHRCCVTFNSDDPACASPLSFLFADHVVHVLDTLARLLRCLLIQYAA